MPRAAENGRDEKINPRSLAGVHEKGRTWRPWSRIGRAPATAVGVASRMPVSRVDDCGGRATKWPG